MRSSALLATLSAFTLACAAAAHADTIQVGSYATTAPNSAGFANTPTFFYNPQTNSLQDTFNIGTGNVWASPTGGSSWVSFNAQSYPGGSYFAPNGSYLYGAAFNEDLPTGYVASGILNVMADDTTSIYLNGHLVLSAATANPATHCTVAAPNCVSPLSVFLDPTYFVNGQNILAFQVDQDFSNATGLDYSGSITSTPEPGSLFLLGTGLLSGAGAMLRKLRS